MSATRAMLLHDSAIMAAIMASVCAVTMQYFTSLRRLPAALNTIPENQFFRSTPFGVSTRQCRAAHPSLGLKDKSATRFGEFQ